MMGLGMTSQHFGQGFDLNCNNLTFFKADFAGKNWSFFKAIFDMRWLKGSWNDLPTFGQGKNLTFLKADFGGKNLSFFKAIFFGILGSLNNCSNMAQCLVNHLSKYLTFFKANFAGKNWSFFKAIFDNCVFQDCS